MAQRTSKLSKDVNTDLPSRSEWQTMREHQEELNLIVTRVHRRCMRVEESGLALGTQATSLQSQLVRLGQQLSQVVKDFDKFHEAIKSHETEVGDARRSLDHATAVLNLSNVRMAHWDVGVAEKTAVPPVNTGFGTVASTSIAEQPTGKCTLTDEGSNRVSFRMPKYNLVLDDVPVVDLTGSCPPTDIKTIPIKIEKLYEPTALPPTPVSSTKRKAATETPIVVKKPRHEQSNTITKDETASDYDGWNNW